ncbi:MAG: TetR/AcrR family transcriptional regulator [Euryarchaeota archaeon]|nr:TetR/AcrR family transcriptional regulator [Euryarchaeota archaeon]
MPSKGVPSRRLDFVLAAQSLFEEKGFENTSVDDIAARVGVAKGLFYYYFGSKEEMLEVIIERLMDEIDSSIAAAMEKKGLSAIERFSELISASTDVTSRSKVLLSYFQKERNQACHLAMEKRAMNMIAPALEQIIRQGNEEGVFDAPHPISTAIALAVMLNGVRRSFPTDLTAEEVVHVAAVMQHLSERLLGARPGTITAYHDQLP